MSSGTSGLLAVPEEAPASPEALALPVRHGSDLLQQERQHLPQVKTPRKRMNATEIPVASSARYVDNDAFTSVSFSLLLDTPRKAAPLCSRGTDSTTSLQFWML